ncbi:MAG: hypothetical protein J7M18_03655, partial [Candidatus Eremiobacteraeota bacterium]|nr:hypothetical protein [Candidatus Eremiobacteraeota bacterium]
LLCRDMAKMGKTGAAKKMLEKLLKDSIASGDSVLLLAQGKLLNEIGELNRAEQNFREAIDCNTQVSAVLGAYLGLADVLIAKNQLRRAIGVLVDLCRELENRMGEKMAQGLLRDAGVICAEIVTKTAKIIEKSRLSPENKHTFLLKFEKTNDYYRDQDYQKYVQETEKFLNKLQEKIR